MRRSRRSKWVSGIGAVVLIGGLVLANYGSGVTPAAAANNPPPNPFTVIIDKLNQILAALTGAAGQNNHTLRWDTNNASATRFTVLAAISGAVLDNNTGLVWEQAPDGTPRSWAAATVYCVNQEIGGTAGWRLPSVVELKSLQDGSSGAVAPFVPAPPFTISTSDATPGVQSTEYWSATTDAGNPAFAWSVNFASGSVNDIFNKSGTHHAWCVRGGMNADQY